ncbi:MAG TPA: magnesium/cobalt transporter CorA [Rectinema sp.]|nr:magnesium/cobalt transporter CorA [Rectinema sp.]HOR48867.1 magnesium/cobalt transporter CorA [Rectinema sp.]
MRWFSKKKEAGESAVVSRVSSSISDGDVAVSEESITADRILNESGLPSGEKAKTTKPKHHLSKLPFTGVSVETAGLPPGTPHYIGDVEPTLATYSLYSYDEASAVVRTPEDISELLALIDLDVVNWININGLSGGIVEKLCGMLGIHPLVIEDIMNTEHRPKFENYDDYLFLITKMITALEDGSVEYDQVSFVLKGKLLISFQEKSGDCFKAVRDRIMSGAGRLRKHGADYLLYALLDSIVDNYFIVLEMLGDRLEQFEGASDSESDQEFFHGIQGLKREFSRMRRIIWPVRDSISALSRTESIQMDVSLSPYLRDLYENTVQAIEALESYREHATSMIELHLSEVNTNMSRVMTLLTILSAIFIPITFIAGIYGMNFAYMPELNKPWGYPAALAFMAAVVIAELIYFKKKKWM